MFWNQKSITYFARFSSYQWASRAKPCPSLKSQGLILSTHIFWKNLQNDRKQGYDLTATSLMTLIHSANQSVTVVPRDKLEWQTSLVFRSIEFAHFSPFWWHFHNTSSVNAVKGMKKRDMFERETINYRKGQFSKFCVF